MSLLDFLSSDGAQLGMNLMAAGGASTDPNMNFGARLTGAVNSTRASRDANEDRAIKRTLLNSQIAENEAQAEAKRAAMARQAQMDAYYMGGGALGGASKEGADLKAAIGAPPDTPRPPQGKFAEWSQQFGIPVDALVSDYMSNGGKGIAEMLMKKGTPDMQVANGYAYDKNKMGAGYLPALNFSANGTATQVQIGPDGQPVISAPRGALGTLGAYKGVEAQYTPGQGEIGPAGRPVPTSLAKDLGIAQPPSGQPVIGRGPGYASNGLAGGDTNAAAQGQLQILSSELPKAQAAFSAAQASGDAAGAARAQADIAGIQREIARLPGGRAVIGNAPPTAMTATAPPAIAVPETGIGVAGGKDFNPMEKAAQAARAKGLDAVVAQDASRLKELTDAATAGQQAVQKASRLREIAKSGIYEGGGANAKAAVGSLIGGITGITPKAQAGSELFNAEASDLVLGQIKALGANPSNADRDFIMKTVPQLTTSPAAREAMINFMEAKGSQAVQAHKRADAQFRKTGSLEGFNAAEQNEPPAKPSVPAVGTVQQGYRFKGGNPASKSSWEPI